MKVPAMSDLSVLIVDDEPFIRNLAQHQLNSLGINKISQATNGNAALKQIASAVEPIDVIICDLNMPEVDGIEFLRLVKNTDYTGALILVSGEDRTILSSAFDLAKAHELKVLGAMSKPLSILALASMLSRLDELEDERGFDSEEPLTYEEIWGEMRDQNCPALELFYQPLVHVPSGQIKRVEALARWNHPQRGRLGPGTFIPQAEQWDLIDRLTSTIFEKAVRQAADWSTKGVDLGMSVNFSVNTFSIEYFLHFITKKTEEFGVSPARITLEITESQIMQDYKNCVEKMARLRLKKYGLAIDDFGTGNSTLVQLKSMPFSELKIDRSVVNKSSTDPELRAILESSVDLAKKLNLTIVAEGVETAEDWDLVEGMGCDYVQGYYCAKPMPAEEILDFVSSWGGPFD